MEEPLDEAKPNAYTNSDLSNEKCKVSSRRGPKLNQREDGYDQEGEIGSDHSDTEQEADNRRNVSNLL